MREYTILFLLCAGPMSSSDGVNIHGPAAFFFSSPPSPFSSCGHRDSYIYIDLYTKRWAYTIVHVRICLGYSHGCSAKGDDVGI